MLFYSLPSKFIELYSKLHSTYPELRRNFLSIVINLSRAYKYVTTKEIHCTKKVAAKMTFITTQQQNKLFIAALFHHLFFIFCTHTLRIHTLRQTMSVFDPPIQGVARANKGNEVYHVWIMPGWQIRYLYTNYQSFFDAHTLYSYQVTNHLHSDWKGNYCSLYLTQVWYMFFSVSRATRATGFIIFLRWTVTISMAVNPRLCSMISHSLHMD